MMTDRLLPHSSSELCVHALELERVCERRISSYAAAMRAIGERTTALALERTAHGLRDEIEKLEAGSGARAPATLTPWEYAWRLTYMPESMEEGPRVVPATAREALQFAVQARRRAAIFYEDVAANGGDPVVCAAAAEMATSK